MHSIIIYCIIYLNVLLLFVLIDIRLVESLALPFELALPDASGEWHKWHGHDVTFESEKHFGPIRPRPTKKSRIWNFRQFVNSANCRIS